MDAVTKKKSAFNEEKVEAHRHSTCLSGHPVGCLSLCELEENLSAWKRNAWPFIHARNPVSSSIPQAFNCNGEKSVHFGKYYQSLEHCMVPVLFSSLDLFLILFVLVFLLSWASSSVYLTHFEHLLVSDSNLLRAFDFPDGFFGADGSTLWNKILKIDS